MKMLAIAALAFSASMAFAVPNNIGQINDPNPPHNRPCTDGATSTTWVDVQQGGRGTVVEEPVRAICESGVWVIPGMPAAAAPEVSTCTDGTYSTSWITRKDGARDNQQIPIRVVCQGGEWVPVHGQW